MFPGYSIAVRNVRSVQGKERGRTINKMFPGYSIVVMAYYAMADLYKAMKEEKPVDHIRDTNSEGLFTGMVLLDLQKAFDTVDHNILCGKLNNMGIQAHWFHS